MRTHPITCLLACSATVVGGLGGPSAAASGDDDQARADAAMQAFNERLLDAGFGSAGPPEQNDDDVEDFEQCFGDLATLMATSQGATEGETARSFSDEFRLTPKMMTATADSKPVGSTEPAAADDEHVESDESDDEEDADDDAEEDQEELAAAFVVTVDEANRDDVEAFVTQFGTDEAADCFEQEIATAIFGDGSDTIPEGYGAKVEVRNESDLGIGDHSASIEFDVQFLIMGSRLDMSVTYVAAQSGRSLVIVLHGNVGGFERSGFDPEAEVATIVTSLAE